MRDVREEILVRLLAIAGAVPGVVTAARNRNNIAENERPAILILDADEAAEPNDPVNRPANAPRRIGMTPEIYILLGAKPDNVGASINGLRQRFLGAVMHDAELGQIIGTNGRIRYEGCATGLTLGRKIEAEMGVSMTFSYFLIPSDLTA
jgi:hypothetical protein